MTTGRRWLTAVAATAFVLVAAAFAYGWETQSGYYALLPDNAHPASTSCTPPAASRRRTDTGFYFVDVSELHANLIQKLWAEHLVEGARWCPTARSSRPASRTSSACARTCRDDRLPGDGTGGGRAGAGEAGADRTAGRPDRWRSRTGYPADKAGIAAWRHHHRGQRASRALGRRPDGRDEAGDAGAVRAAEAAGQGDVTLATMASKDPPPHALIGGVDRRRGAGRQGAGARSTFSTGDIGGPSAGLAFALEIYDSLSGRTPAGRAQDRRHRRARPGRRGARDRRRRPEDDRRDRGRRGHLPGARRAELQGRQAGRARPHPGDRRDKFHAGACGDPGASPAR